MIDQQIKDTVHAFMAQGKMFTSLDIANVMKTSGIIVRNRQVAEWLRSNAIALSHANGFPYNQSLITVDAKQMGPTLAYLYHHYMDAPDDYLDRDQNPLSHIGVKANPLSQSVGVAIVVAAQQSTPRPDLTLTAPVKPTRKGHDGWKKQRRDAQGRFI